MGDTISKVCLLGLLLGLTLGGCTTSPGQPDEPEPLAESDTEAVLPSSLAHVGFAAGGRRHDRNTAYIQLLKPALTVNKWAVPETILCEPFPVKYVVTNSGTGTAMNVVIKEKLPDNVSVVDRPGVQEVSFHLDQLQPGESELFTVQLQAKERGEISGWATASAYDGITAQSQVTTTLVQQPVLSIDSETPEAVTLKSSFDHRFTLSNRGDTVADDTVIAFTLPSDVRLVSVTDNGQVLPGQIIWGIGSMAPGDVIQVHATYETPCRRDRQQHSGCHGLLRANRHCDCCDAVGDSLFRSRGSRREGADRNR